jgi:hypothetical protein
MGLAGPGVRTRCGDARGPVALPRTSFMPRNPFATATGRGVAGAAHGAKPVGPVRSSVESGARNDARARSRTKSAGPGHPGHRRLAARRGPRSTVGRARCLVRYDSVRAQSLVVLARRAAKADRGSRGRVAGPGSRCAFRWPAQLARCRSGGLARGASPAVPVPLPARSGATIVGGGPPCKKGIKKTRACYTRRRTFGRTAKRCDQRSGAGLLLGENRLPSCQCQVACRSRPS